MLNQWKSVSLKRDLLADLKSFAAGLKLQQIGEVLAAAVIIIPLLIAATHAVQVTVTGGDPSGNGAAAISGTTNAAPGGITSFTPSDPAGHPRVNGRPGDRTVSYCNNDSVGVFIILPGGTGVGTGDFTFAALKAAEPGGVTKDLGALGVVTATMDAQGNIYIAWTGGYFNATGQGDYAKSFKCS